MRLLISLILLNLFLIMMISCFQREMMFKTDSTVTIISTTWIKQ
jgi:hypothetical protein